jgi:signal transduction histidine kinase
MQPSQTEIEIIISIIVITILLLLLAGFIVFTLLHYQKRHNHYKREKADMQASFHQELLKAEIEMKEQTLLTISQEIHDNIGQVLSLAKLNLNTILLEDNNPAVPKIAATKELVGKAIQDLRNLSKSLNTEHISHQKLSESLGFELDQIRKTGLYETALRVQGAEKPLDPQKQIIIFRIVQEALNNIIKHARARSITISLDYDARETMLRIADDGAGFDLPAVHDPDRTDKGTGMGNLFHRARLIDGRLTVESRPGQGTLIQLSLPTTQT